MVSCDMMHGGTIEDPFAMKYLANNDFQLVRIPFKDYSRFEMVCIMPRNTSCIEFISGIDGTQWNDLMESSHLGELILSMPKFEQSFEYELKNYLRNMGMTTMFTAPDLSGMFVEETPLKIDYVIHDTFISVDESGAEAAAVTVIGVWATSSTPPAPVELTFDHPFIYAIQDAETHAIIFIGIMKDPTQ